MPGYNFSGRGCFLIHVIVEIPLNNDHVPHRPDCSRRVLAFLPQDHSSSGDQSNYLPIGILLVNSIQPIPLFAAHSHPTDIVSLVFALLS